jgi:serine O-acetyltransferase
MELGADIAKACESQSGGRLRRLLRAFAEPGLQAVFVYRFGRWTLGLPALLRVPLSLPYFALSLAMRVLWGIELPRSAQVGPGLYIGHFGGIIVSPLAVIGGNCSLSHGVTIGFGGSRGKGGVPVIGDGVYIGPGACLYGRIRIGDNVKIGPHAVIYQDIPDNAVVAVDPGFRILSMKGNHRAHDAEREDSREARSAGASKTPDRIEAGIRKRA